MTTLKWFKIINWFFAIALLVLTLIAVVSLHAEDALYLPKFPKYSAGTVTAAYLLYVDTTDAVCAIPLGADRAIVKVGTPGKCWEYAVIAHNEAMNDPANHLVADKILNILAHQFGKQFKADAR